MDSYETFYAAYLKNDSLQNVQRLKMIDELTTQYEVDKHIAEKERNRNYFLFASGGCILLAIVLGVWIYYSRKIAKKNKTLAAQIKELQEQQEKTEAELLSKTTFEIENDPDDDLCPESRKNELCIAIRDIILKDKAYRDSTLTRDLLVERLGTNKNIFIDAFQYCFGMPFPEFINNLRLKDAITLLEDSDLSMDEISQRVGFGSLRTFQRQFQNKYNMTPKEYRKALTK
ncbi:MAG: AraC family transcriptional regulator [Prevotella sp.]|nr:AraC family transcriptional regulator [Prevotella sp.]